MAGEGELQVTQDNSPWLTVDPGLSLFALLKDCRETQSAIVGLTTEVEDDSGSMSVGNTGGNLTGTLKRSMALESESFARKKSNSAHDVKETQENA